MRVVQRYSLLSFMTLRQFCYPQVVHEFYHTMTSRGVSNQMQLHFNIDSSPGILRALDITAALGLLVDLANFTDYRQWPHPSPREMVRSLSLSIQQLGLSFFGGSFLRICSSQTTCFSLIYSCFNTIFSIEELF